MVPSASIALVHLERGLERKALTNDAGEFEIPDLNWGTYRLTATAPGFTTFIADNVSLESGQIRRVNVLFQLGEVTTRVMVREGAQVIATEGSKIASSFTHRRIEENPIYGDGRNPILILTTMPFIQSYSLYNLRMAGQAQDQVQTGLDGHTNDGRSTMINLMDVQEVQAVPVNNTAENARVGYLNMVPKSGTNSWHGQYTYWHQNSALAARDTFAPRKTPQKDHTYSANIGGPIIRNKTFFYFSWYGQKFPGSSFNLRSVPTERMRAGDFSQLQALRRPVVVKDPTTGAPFPNNAIPSSRLNPVALKVNEQYLSAPNRGSPDALSNNFEWFHPYASDALGDDYLTFRLDHTLSEKNTFNVRLSGSWLPYLLVRNYPALNWTRNRYNRHIVVNDTHIFSPSLVNSFRLGFQKTAYSDGRTVKGFTPKDGAAIVKELGIQGVNPTGVSGMGFPTMRISGYTALDVIHGGEPVQNDRNWGFFDSVTWSKGSHVLKFGGEWKPQSQSGGRIPTGTFGNFSFTGAFTGHAYGDFLLGMPNSSTRIERPLIDRTRLDSELGLFITDTFKVSNRLTLDLGLRWDHFGPASLEDGLMFNWDPATGNVIVAPDAMDQVSPLYPTHLIGVVAGEVRENPSNHNFAPRLGAAFRVTDKTVIRGGYGLFALTEGRYDRALEGGPFQLAETFFNSIDDRRPLFQMPLAFPSGSGRIAAQSISGYPRNTDNGRVHQFNMSLERQIAETGFRLSYVGSRSRGMNYRLNINKPQAGLIPFSASRRPYPQFVNTTWLRTDGAHNYNALNFQVVRKVGSVIFDNHWTWTSSLLNTQAIEDPYAPLQWSRDPNYSTHRAVFNVTWQLPVGRGRRFLTNARGVADHVLGGWSLYWLGLLETGFHFTPSFSGADPSNTNTIGGRPDRIADGNLPVDTRSLNRWFDVGAFAVPPKGRFGNSGYAVLEGPGFNGQSLTLMKTFRLTERISWMFGAAMENFINHPNYGMPDANISSQAAGVISGTKGGDWGSRRKVVLRTRLEF